MSNSHRYFVSGGLVFFTVVTYQRRPILTTAVGGRCLREALVTIRARRPFEIPAYYNPVKHRLVRCPRDWSYSSVHRWVDRNVYDPDWGCASHGPPSFDDLDETLME